MLDVFRRGAKGWTAKILLGLLVLSFGVWGVADVFRGGGQTGTLAKVGGIEISATEFNRTFNERLQELSRQLGQPVSIEEARKLGIDRQVLAEMMRGAAFDAQAAKMKLAISNSQIAAKISANPTFHNSKGEFDPELLKAILARNGISEASYVASERQQFLRKAIGDNAGSNFTPPKVLVEAAYKHRNEQRDANYFVVRPKPEDIPAATEADLKKFYDDNPQQYTAPEYRTIAAFRAEPEDLAAVIPISDADLMIGYEKYKRDYFTPETRTILQITFPSVDDAKKAKDRITAGEDFLAIAKERGLSEADATLLGTTRESIPDEKIADAAFKLPEGQVSDPVEGRLSVVLLKIQKVTPEKQSTLDEVKDQLRGRLQLEKAREQLQSVYDSVEDARAAQTSFEDIAKRANLKFFLATTDARGLGKDGKDVDLPSKEEVLKQAFQTDSGIENDALATAGDGYLWYEVREVIPAAVKPYDSVKAQVEADWKSRRTRELALDMARKLVEKGKSGAKLDDLAKEAGAEIKTIQGLKRNETSADFDAQAVSALFAAPESGFAFAPDGDGKGAKIMQSQAVLLPPFDGGSADAKAVEKAMADGGGAASLDLYVNKLQSELGVSVDEALWSQVTGANAN
ncbi:SurA N-terminal domain-containing protein [soil metagenome]